jgi:hypothetical protein
MSLESRSENDPSLADYRLGFAVMNHLRSQQSDVAVPMFAVVPREEILAKVHRKFKPPARPKFTPVRECPALDSASDKKNSINLALVLGLNRILNENAAAA